MEWYMHLSHLQFVYDSHLPIAILSAGTSALWLYGERMAINGERVLN